jgi:hypothetical protein
MIDGGAITGVAVGELPLQSLHPDWSEDWGASIRSPRNRKAILANRRLSGRLSADLARRLEIDPIDAVPPADAHALKVFASDPKRFMQVAGLVTEAHRLAGIIDAPTLRDLSQAFPLEDIRTAIACRSLVPDTDETGLDLDNLAVAAREAGPKLILGWADQVSPALRGHIRLMLPKSLIPLEKDGNQPGINHVSGKIVRRIAELLSPP